MKIPGIKNCFFCDIKYHSTIKIYEYLTLLKANVKRMNQGSSKLQFHFFQEKLRSCERFQILRATMEADEYKIV